MTTTEPKAHYPLIKAAEIDASLTDRRHWLNTNAVRQTVCLSDMAGLGNECAVHKSSLEPGVESTELHHHLNASEWLYILTGSGTLFLAPADPVETGTATSGYVQNAPYTGPVEEIHVSAGDFMGHPAGTGKGQYAHGMRAGPEGMTYLLGGTRYEIDVCVYPLKGKAIIINRDGPRAYFDSTTLTDPSASPLQ